MKTARHEVPRRESQTPTRIQLNYRGCIGLNYHRRWANQKALPMGVGMGMGMCMGMGMGMGVPAYQKAAHTEAPFWLYWRTSAAPSPSSRHARIIFLAIWFGKKWV